MTAGTVRDCRCPQARHVHGTKLAYIRDKCRCDQCRTASVAYDRAHRRQLAYGRYDSLVDAEPVRAHVRMLSEHGVGRRQIIRLAGVSGGVLTRLMYGMTRGDGSKRAPSVRVSKSVAERVLSVQPGDLAGCALIDATGTRRRLQALVAIGWSQSKLAAHLGMTPSSFGKTLRRDRVTVATRDAVADLYERLWNVAPPQTCGRDKVACSRARRHAAESGWLPPLAWDDDDLDKTEVTVTQLSYDGDTALDEIAIDEAMRGRRVALTRDERAEAMRRLNAAGLSARLIAERLGTTSRTVVRKRAA